MSYFLITPTLPTLPGTSVAFPPPSLLIHRHSVTASQFPFPYFLYPK